MRDRHVDPAVSSSTRRVGLGVSVWCFLCPVAGSGGSPSPGDEARTATGTARGTSKRNETLRRRSRQNFLRRLAPDLRRRRYRSYRRTGKQKVEVEITKEKKSTKGSWVPAKEVKGREEKEKRESLWECGEAARRAPRSGIVVRADAGVGWMRYSSICFASCTSPLCFWCCFFSPPLWCCKCRYFSHWMSRFVDWCVCPVELGLYLNQMGGEEQKKRFLVECEIDTKQIQVPKDARFGQQVLFFLTRVFALVS